MQDQQFENGSITGSVLQLKKFGEFLHQRCKHVAGHHCTAACPCFHEPRPRLSQRVRETSPVNWELTLCDDLTIQLGKKIEA